MDSISCTSLTLFRPNVRIFSENMWRSRDATCCDVNVACVSLEHVWSANIKDFECVCVAMQYRPPTESYDAAYRPAAFSSSSFRIPS